MARSIDIILSAIDNMSPVIDDATKSVDDLGNSLQETAENGSKSTLNLRDAFNKVTGVLTVAGAAMAAYAQSNKELFIQADQAAISLGMTSKEFTNLATEVANVNLPIETAVSLLELAGKQGLESTEDLKEFTNFWNDLANATGGNAEELAKGASGLRAMGIAAGSESDSLNAYGIILKNTSIDIAKFNELASKNSESAKLNGLSIDQLAGAYAYMQNELGLTAEMMESQFDQIMLTSKDEIISYSQTLEDASGYVQKLADAHDENASVFDKFKQGISEMTLKYQDQIQIMGDFGSIMGGLSAILNVGSAAQGLYATFTAASGVAATTAVPGILSFAAGVVAATWPILLIVAAIAALIAIIVLVVKNFDKLKKAASMTIDFVRKSFETGIEAIKKVFITAIDFMLLPFKLFINFIIAGVNNVIKAINLLGGSLKTIDTLDLSIGDMSISRSSEQTINVNSYTQIDGREVAKSTASATRRVSASNKI